MSSTQIVDIRIVSVVKERIQQDSQFPGLYDYFFKLSAQPPSGWSGFFDRIRSLPRHTKWQKAWIEGDCVVIKCALDELESNLEELKEDIATTNKNYMNAKEKEDSEMQQENGRKEKAREEQDKVLDRLNFD